MAARKAKTITLVPDKVKKPSGLKNDGTPNVAWRKFQERLAAYSSKPVSEWKYEEILAHIFKRYSDVFGMNYSLSFSGAPTKCSEIYCVKRMVSFLSGENINPTMAKDFVDWTFDSVIIPKKVQVESLAFFFSVGLVKEFKAKFKKASTITRSTQLPKDFENIINDLGIDGVYTYGELAFVKKALNNNPDNAAYKPYHILLTMLGDKGLDLKVLDNLD